jgi:Zn finger protein HypA/HybF involved in hydrogenase expression
MKENMGFYRIKVRCNNCRWNGKISVQKGREIPKSFWDSHIKDKKCPNCECIKLEVNDWEDD